jgi:hypothetical protein
MTSPGTGIGQPSLRGPPTGVVRWCRCPVGVYAAGIRGRPIVAGHDTAHGLRRLDVGSKLHNLVLPTLVSSPCGRADRPRLRAVHRPTRTRPGV